MPDAQPRRRSILDVALKTAQGVCCWRCGGSGKEAVHGGFGHSQRVNCVACGGSGRV